MENLISDILGGVQKKRNEIEEQLKTLSIRCFKGELKERFLYKTLLTIIEAALNFYLPYLFFFFT